MLRCASRRSGAMPHVSPLGASSSLASSSPISTPLASESLHPRNQRTYSYSIEDLDEDVDATSSRSRRRRNNFNNDQLNDQDHQNHSVSMSITTSSSSSQSTALSTSTARSTVSTKIEVDDGGGYRVLMEDDKMTVAVGRPREVNQKVALQEVVADAERELEDIRKRLGSSAARSPVVAEMVARKEASTLMNLVDKMRKAVAWFGPGGTPKYIRDVSAVTGPEELPLERRKFLNPTHSPAKKSTPPSERQRSADVVRALKAQEGATNYQKSMEERLQDLRRPTTLEGWGGLAEARIREAMVDWVPSGKPQRGLSPDDEDDANPMLDNTTRLMNRIMQRNGCLPYWVELDREVETLVEQMREELSRVWSEWKKESAGWDATLMDKIMTRRSTSGEGRHGDEADDDDDDEDVPITKQSEEKQQVWMTKRAKEFKDSMNWNDSKVLMETRVKKLNSKILTFNLVAPSMYLQKFPIDLENELKRIAKKELARAIAEEEEKEGKDESKEKEREKEKEKERDRIAEEVGTAAALRSSYN